jgi:TRAP-type C4-dicarboxylate transport system substrate-binding protein
MTEDQVIGHRVRVARRAMGLRQSDLSEMPTIPTLRKIGDALGRPLVYFLQAGEDQPRSVGMVINISSIGGQAAVRFAELVEGKTGGQHKVRIYDHSKLGTAREQIEGLAEGAIDIYIDELLVFEYFAELCGPVCLPYFFRDKNHYRAFLQSAIFEKYIYQKLLKRGIRLLEPVSNWGSGSFEILLSTDPVFTPSDLAGRKLRSYDSPAAIALRRALGADPVVVEWADAPQAFKESRIDTFLTPAIYLDALQPYEFAKNATLISYGYTLGLTVAVNDHAYRRMPPDLQSALVKAAQETGAYCTHLVNEQTIFTLERLPTEYGLPVIHPNQQAWRHSFDAAIRQICDDGLLPRKMYEDIHSL